MSTPKLFSFSRSALPFAAVVAVIFIAVGHARAASRWATLEAIHALENPQNLPRPGSHGELGAYQFRASTWRMHTSTPFSRAIDRPTSDVVAVQHYEWLRKSLEAARIPATSYNIALAWNSGFGAVTRGQSPARSHVYALRAANLAASLDAERPQLVADGR